MRLLLLHLVSYREPKPEGDFIYRIAQYFPGFCLCQYYGLKECFNARKKLLCSLPDVHVGVKLEM